MPCSANSPHMGAATALSVWEEDLVEVFSTICLNGNWKESIEKWVATIIWAFVLVLALAVVLIFAFAFTLAFAASFNDEASAGVALVFAFGPHHSL